MMMNGKYLYMQEMGSGRSGGRGAQTRPLSQCLGREALHEEDVGWMGVVVAEVNEAMDHLRAGKARYRIVLENDLKA